MSLHKKWSFPLRIPSVNVTKSAVSWHSFLAQFAADLVTFTEAILNGKHHFLYSVNALLVKPAVANSNIKHTFPSLNVTQISRSSHKRCSVRKDFVWNFAKFTWKHLCQRLFSNKRVSSTSAFLWIMRNFLEHLFYRTPPDGCFWISESVS